MKIYLASRYSRRLELIEYRCELHAMGHLVTSRWLNGKHQIDKEGVPIGDHGEALVESGDSVKAFNLRAHFVTEDCEDVRASDVLVSFTEPARSALGNRGGRHVEFGLAVAWDKGLFVVGHRENLFHYLPQVHFCETWEECRTCLTP